MPLYCNNINIIIIPDAFLSRSGCSDPILQSPSDIPRCPEGTLLSLPSSGAGERRTARIHVCFPRMSFRSWSWALGNGREVDRNSDSGGGSHQSDLQQH